MKPAISFRAKKIETKLSHINATISAARDKAESSVSLAQESSKLLSQSIQDVSEIYEELGEFFAVLYEKSDT